MPTVTSPQTDAERQRKTIEKVAKLLALAADPRTPDGERQSAAAKAADLMTRAGIDEAQLRAARGEGPEPIEVYPYAVAGGGGYGTARASVACRIGEALGCRVALKTAPTPRPCTAVIVGAAADLATVRALVPLILTQAEHAAGTAAGWQPERRRPSFVRSFLIAYGQTVAARIRERRGTLAEEAAAAGTGADLILADRDQRVRAVYQDKFPDRTQIAVSGASEAGRYAGRRAGHLANLGDAGIAGAGCAELTDR
jgi:Protein of unknown function (DUF2786)